MTNEEFRRIITYVEAIAGIHLEEKRVLVEGRLDFIVQRHGYGSYSEYMNAVESDKIGNLKEELINALTTNHTYFMRETTHFDFFKDIVLPELKRKNENTRDLRIWCGASSSGEEPYTLAMIISDYFSLEIDRWDTTLLATDISTDVLKQALAGIYTVDQIQALPDMWKRRYFKQIDDEHVQVVKDLKDRVLFRQFNLMSPLPFRKPLQVVFLRNVLIYFDAQHKNDLLMRIYDSLEPGGYLFVGTTESVDRNKIPFEYVEPSVYRKGLR